MNREEIAPEISSKSGWNTIRWGWRDFRSESGAIVDALLESSEGITPEFFLVGRVAVGEVKGSGLLQDPTEHGDEIGYLSGLPAYLDLNMPPDMIAVIAPGAKLFPGEPKYEVTHNQASWLLIEGSQYREATQPD